MKTHIIFAYNLFFIVHIFVIITWMNEFVFLDKKKICRGDVMASGMRKMGVNDVATGDGLNGIVGLGWTTPNS